VAAAARPPESLLYRNFLRDDERRAPAGAGIESSRPTVSGHPIAVTSSPLSTCDGPFPLQGKTDVIKKSALPMQCSFSMLLAGSHACIPRKMSAAGSRGLIDKSHQSFFPQPPAGSPFSRNQASTIVQGSHRTAPGETQKGGAHGVPSLCISATPTPHLTILSAFSALSMTLFPSSLSSLVYILFSWRGCFSFIWRFRIPMFLACPSPVPMLG